MKQGRIYRYLSEERWANVFMDGSVQFRTLAYYRDYEDGNVRGDQREGSSLFRPEGGLVGFNQTQGRPFAMPDHRLVSSAKQGEIFVLCTSRTLSESLCAEFKATLCVEIVDVPEFCRRITKALPTHARFAGRSGHTRIGHRVEYYEETDAPTPRWALPDSIGTAKLRDYQYQDEFRLLFSLTDALDFEKVSLRLEPRGTPHVPDPSQHHDHIVKGLSLRDICVLHRF